MGGKVLVIQTNRLTVFSGRRDELILLFYFLRATPGTAGLLGPRLDPRCQGGGDSSVGYSPSAELRDNFADGFTCISKLGNFRHEESPF